MKVSEMIAWLDAIHRGFGDLPVVGGYLMDDTLPSKLIVLDEDGCETLRTDNAVGVFIE